MAKGSKKGFDIHLVHGGKKSLSPSIGTDSLRRHAEGDPNSAGSSGDYGCIVSTPRRRRRWRTRGSNGAQRHRHADQYVCCRIPRGVSGNSALSPYHAQAVIASHETWLSDRVTRPAGLGSEYGRVPRLFQDAESIPVLTLATLSSRPTVDLGSSSSEVRLYVVGAGTPRPISGVCAGCRRKFFFLHLIEYHSPSIAARRLFARMADHAEREVRAFKSQGDAPVSRRCSQGLENRARRRICDDALISSAPLYGAANRVTPGRNLKKRMAAALRGDGIRFSTFAIY